MTNESFFALAIAGMLALFLGFVLLFGGYRFFIFLLPVWGFFFGFGLGAQTVQAIFGDAFLSTVTSWVVGFILAIIFATLSYLFYFAAVAVLAGPHNNSLLRMENQLWVTPRVLDPLKKMMRSSQGPNGRARS